ncbi:hypothetical protein [Sphingomonas sp. LY160]|uniref:hypothetical protein n=1 Tax=Sphingomonas sp. LY160 TaxID=3095342 RepID=UPI002ADECBC5|nr:hypothetical protein [Sphingomonas sp. LY160]MEA1072621.1 hypothetical protein [Sphingomonas sp. LY160]
MRISITKGHVDDRIDIDRDDGTKAVTHFPKKGPIPHDYVHLAVECRLGLRDAFWGKIAGGADPDAIGLMAKAGGHASASRATKPDPAIVEMVQAERLVECFEADFWMGGGDNRALRDMAASGWIQSQVPDLSLDDAAIDAIRTDIAAFALRWAELKTNDLIDLEWRADA